MFGARSINGQQTIVSHWPTGLGVEFLVSVHDSSKGLLRLEWCGSDGPRGILPAWEFEWDGGFSSDQTERISRVLSWAAEQNKAKIHARVGLHAYSRCKEVYVEMPTLKQEARSLIVCDILHVEAEGDLCKVYYGHTAEAGIKMVDLCIGKCEALLEPYGFVRIHRRHLVNHGCIQGMEGLPGRSSVMLCSGYILPVARRRHKEVKALLEEETPQR